MALEFRVKGLGFGEDLKNTKVLLLSIRIVDDQQQLRDQFQKVQDYSHPELDRICGIWASSYGFGQFHILSTEGGRAGPQNPRSSTPN